ncbi:MAG: RnfABCDGE type electron transport complex subunit D, partial [Phycisphaerae bacterium]|nr:RnfABCDGE type electron transport complex subunit D [Phycisphaerae bacterium]
QVCVCVLTCIAAEGIFTAVRRRPLTLNDLSAVITGMILGLSLPWTAPWYVGVIGSVTAIGIAKVIFGGIGQNIFNPAMVGRAFVMICFASAMGASAYVSPGAVSGLHVISGATPLTAARQAAAPGLWPMFIGVTNGSLGETSALACILGGLYLCIRRTASWQIPAGMIGAVVIIAGAMNIADPQTNLTVLHHLVGGALLFGAFFIATDPVTSPLTPWGKGIFGAGIGALVMLIRVFSGYPEGVMFAVLIMNAMVPLINRWTIPKPVGGPVPEKE